MTWHAHLQHTDTGLALTFAQPVTRLDMTADVAAHLASLLAIEARHRMAGVVGTLFNIQLAENKQNRVTRGLAGLNPVRAENKQNALARRQSQSQSQKRLYITSRDARHPHFCDCDPCLNGDRQ